MLLPTTSLSRRRIALVVPTLCAAVLFLAACGGSGDGSGGGSLAAGNGSETAAASPSPSASGPSASGTSPSPAASGGATIQLSGGFLTDGSGRTVYLWVADTGPMSTCSGACATAWPPVPVTGQPRAGSGVNAAQLTAITRGDGTQQVVYAGHPLYYYMGDQKAGDATGQGSNGFGAKWWKVDASGNAITSTASASPSDDKGSGGQGKDDNPYGY